MSNLFDSIIITGGGGMLAQAMIRALQSRGHNPMALNRAALDVTDVEAVRDMTQKKRPTLIINCAAYTKVDQCEQETALAGKINCDGAGHLASAANAAEAKLVHISTDFVFNGQSKRPYTPDDATDPLSAYGRTKLQGELIVREILKDQALIIRTAWLYGPGGPNFPKTMLDVARAGKPLRVVNDQIGAPTFTDDLAAATLDLLDKNAQGIFHVTNSGQTNWFDFAKAIFEEFGLSPDLQPTTAAEWKKLRPQSATRPAYSVLDLAAYEAATGKSMPNWRDGLHRFRLALEAAK